MGNNRIAILLTACVDPSKSVNRWLKISNKEERLGQYVDAIEYYCKNTDKPIVFVDNSGIDISCCERIRNFAIIGRIEVLTYLASEEVRCKGKGFGEQDIIKYALTNSELLKNAEYIIKITGRIKVLDIKFLINLTDKLAKRGKFVIGEKLFRAEWIQSYCFIAHKDFFSNEYFEEMLSISEEENSMKSFEECLYNLVKYRNNGCNFYHVLKPINVSGICAGFGWDYYCDSWKNNVKCTINAFLNNNLHIL